MSIDWHNYFHNFSEYFQPLIVQIHQELTEFNSCKTDVTADADVNVMNN